MKYDSSVHPHVKSFNHFNNSCISKLVQRRTIAIHAKFSRSGGSCSTPATQKVHTMLETSINKYPETHILILHCFVPLFPSLTEGAYLGKYREVLSIVRLSHFSAHIAYWSLHSHLHGSNLHCMIFFYITVWDTSILWIKAKTKMNWPITRLLPFQLSLANGNGWRYNILFSLQG